MAFMNVFSIGRIVRILLVALAIGGVALPLLPRGAGATGPGTWSYTGSMGVPREAHAATLLNSGKVLVAGGWNGTDLKATRLFDPATGAWGATGDLGTAHSGHTATLLPNGKVLIVGGYAPGAALKSAELYDPGTGTWTPTGGLITARHSHTATLLLNGKVLVAGGCTDDACSGLAVTATAELYDPATGFWANTNPMASARRAHTATLLPSGKVLVAGSGAAELYDPATQTWSPAGLMATFRLAHTATLLPNGKVLAVGGHNGQPLATAELYDPATKSWGNVSSIGTPRWGHSATLLPEGKVLVAGGCSTTSLGCTVLASAQRYDPGANGWSPTGGLNTARFLHTATLLPDGRVLVAGGCTGGNCNSYKIHSPLATAELYSGAPVLPPGGGPMAYTLSLSAGPGGTASGGGSYPAGAVATLAATPVAGQVFTGWTVDGQFAGWANPLTLTMDADHAITASFVPRPSFPDVPAAHPAAEAIGQLAARGIIKGYADGRFGPGDSTLRAQMAALIARALGWDAEDHGNPFPDRGSVDADLWRNVGTLAFYGVAKGYPDGTYKPTNPVLNAQVISFVTRAMVARGYWQAQPDDPALYPDVPASSGHRADLATYHYYAGAVPGTDPFAGWGGWAQPSTRGWFALAQWQALDSYFGADRTP